MKKSILIIVSVLLWCMAGQVYAQRADDYNLQRATEYMENSEFDRAVEYLNLHLQENPKSFYGYFLRAVINDGNEKYSFALSDINNAIKYFKKNQDLKEYTLYWWRATIYNNTEMYDKAIEDYTKAYKLALKIKDSETIRGILSDRAQLYYTLEDYEKSDADYKLMLKNDESYVLPMMGLARNMIKREKYKEAIEIINKCEKLDNTYTEVYRFRMQAYDKLGETKFAIKDAFKYIRYAENPEETLYKDILKKDLNYAIILVKQLCSEEKDNLNHRLLLTSLYEWNEEYPKAIAEYNKIEKEYGAGANIYYYRSLAYLQIDEYSRALIDINKYIEATGTASSMALALRSACYQGLGQYDKAIEDINKQIEQLPSYAFFYRARGWQYEMLGDFQSALSDYSTAITLEEDYEYYYMRSRLYFLQDKLELSHADAKEVLSRDTIVNDNTRRHYALYFLGRNEEAIAWVDSLLNTEPSEGAYYEKACLLSLMGDAEGAIAALKTSFEMGRRDIAHTENDDDLKNIRNHPDFIALIAEYKEKLAVETIPYNEKEEDQEAIITEVPMRKMYSGVYEVDCSINNLPLKFIFDTGAASVTISLVEAQFMIKNGYLKYEDIKGKEYYSVANGDIHEGTIIRLKEIKIGDAVLRNIEASVVHSQQAPLLLGQTVLERFGTITIDNINSKLVIMQ